MEIEQQTTIWDTEEAALYAFATQYCKGGTFNNIASGYVQNAIWQYLVNHTEQSYSNYTRTALYDAAHYYANTWKNSDGSVNLNLKYEDGDAKTRINGSDYIVGPFNISYESESFPTIRDTIVFSKLVDWSVTDQSGRTISAEITNSNGDRINGGTPPNKQDFYIKFRYDETISQVKINAKIEYINRVKATHLKIKTYYQNFKMQWDEPNVWMSTCILHASTCRNFPGGGWEYDADQDVCSSCGSGSTGLYNAWMRGRAVKDGPRSNNDKVYQNMVGFNGEVYTADVTVQLETKIDRQEMDLAGYVWEDGEQGKDQVINGKRDDNEKRLEGIEVRLYNATLGRLADVRFGTNPTLTDSNGHYEFKGLNPTYKYYVVFTYDGILYTNTYGAGVPEYNTQAWSISSKGSEVVSERDVLNKKFITISSYPASYRTTAIFSGNYLTNGYNKIFEINDSRVTYYKNRVTEQLRSYLSTHNRLEDGDSNYINNIYLPIINSLSGDAQTEAKQVLQYIWDCRIKAYAGDESEQDGKTVRAGGKYYPYYDDFALTYLNEATGQVERLIANDSQPHWQGYRAIYNGQLYINLGLIKRPTTDLQLDEDLYKTVVSINGRDETYRYGTFSNKGVKINGADAMVTQDISTDDYDYKVDSASLSNGIAAYPVNYAPIQMYITYRINIRNNSSIPTGVNEIASYIDSKYYSYSDSYTTTGGMTIKGINKLEETGFVSSVIESIIAPLK